MTDAPHPLLNDRCKVSMDIGDNFGDNSATMRCQLLRGHKGPHQEQWSGFANRGLIFEATLTWVQKKKANT